MPRTAPAYKLPPELDLICTAHYLEALKMQAKASEMAALLGGKMPHVMTLRSRRHVPSCPPNRSSTT